MFVNKPSIHIYVVVHLLLSSRISSLNMQLNMVVDRRQQQWIGDIDELQNSSRMRDNTLTYHSSN
jgi:hypothetical protein